MKTLSQVRRVNEAKSLDVQEDAIGYMGAGDLKKYLDIANKFISDDTKSIINYIIDNNDKFGAKDSLQNFYSRGIPKDETLKSIYKAIGKLKKSGRLLEIPQFQTKEQFEGIINKTISPDEILLDLQTEAGRSGIVKKYTPMVHKIARQYINKSNVTYDDLVSAGFEGLAQAMNDYGKYNKDKANSDEDNYKATTFLSFAYARVKYTIIAEIMQNSRTVRVPNSAQRKEKEEKGGITKSNTVSGEKVVSTTKDGATKSLFDTIAATTDGGREFDDKDQDFLWDKVKKRIIELCDENTWKILCWRFGLNGCDKLKNKEIAKKLGVAESLVTYYYGKIIQIFFKDPIIKKYGSELYELLHESACAKDNEDTIFESPVKLYQIDDDE